jgi:hypothetical protein
VEKGNLKVTVSINFSEGSMASFQNELVSLRKLKENIKESIVIPSKAHQAFVKGILMDSFRISYSSLLGWSDLPDFLISPNINNSAIEIVFEISKNQPIPSIYEKEIHGGIFETEWPVLKVLLNNEANLPPYRFMKGLVIEEISINVEVEGVEKMSISNQLGDLDIGNPFQPFGPLPELGSKLKVSSPYFLSRYLSKLALNFHWSGLPLNRNGFTEYYSIYPFDYDNDSFCAELSVQRGKTPIKHRKSYQKFRLFDTEIRDDWNNQNIW